MVVLLLVGMIFKIRPTIVQPPPLEFISER
jgi:hypothetical protein